MKKLLEQPEGDSPKMIEAPPTTTASSSSSSSETVVFQPGVLQELMIEVIHNGTSDKGPSEIGTTSLQRTLAAAPC